MKDPRRTTDTPATLETCALTVQRAGLPLVIDLNLRLEAGDGLLVSGANGAGKTTLLRTLCGLTHPESGAILWRRRSIHKAEEDFRAELLYLGHSHGFKEELTCAENLRFSLGLSGERSSAGDRTWALSQVGLGGLGQRLARQLSQGQKRRLALARLSLSRAPLWILDEPFNALDRRCCGWLEECLSSHLAGGGLALFTSHQSVGAPERLATLELGES